MPNLGFNVNIFNEHKWFECCRLKSFLAQIEEDKWHQKWLNKINIRKENVSKYKMPYGFIGIKTNNKCIYETAYTIETFV